MKGIKIFTLRNRPKQNSYEMKTAERSEIELEENLRRKDLTAYERSKNIARLAKVAAEVLKMKVSFRP